MRQNPDVVYRCVAGEHILIPVGSAAVNRSGMFVLNQVGAEIWNMLETPMSFEEIADELIRRYDAEPETIRKDVTELLERLKTDGLLLD